MIFRQKCRKIHLFTCFIYMEVKMDKAALYLRLSKEDVDKINKGDDSESIVNQRLLLMDYAISHDIQVVDVYSDDDYSGLYDDRPEFDRLLHDSKLGKFNIVIAKSQSRFTRNMEHMEKYLHHDFPLMGIRFIGVVDGVDTQNTANKKSRQINGLVNEWYCEDLSNNIRAVFHQKMKAGQFLGGYAPYGYLKDPNDKYKFVIDEYAADVIRRIYALFLEGYSVKAICHILEDEDVLNPTLYKKKQGLTYKNAKSDEFGAKYNLWSETTVKRILTDDVYIGRLTQGKYQKASYKDKKIVPVSKDHWYITENHHEPIIDNETYYKVAALRSKRRICVDSQYGDKKKVHIFAGKLCCKECGHTMIKSGGVRGRKDDWYLRCQLSNKSRRKECTSHNIRYSTIENVVLEKIQELVKCALEDKSKLDSLLNIISDSDNKETLQNKKKELRKLDSDIENVSKSVKALYFDRISQQIEEDMFFQLKADFENELQNLKSKKKIIDLDIEKLEYETDSKSDVIEVVRRHTNYSKLTHEIVNDFIDYIEIGEKNKETEEQEIIIHWNF